MSGLGFVVEWDCGVLVREFGRRRSGQIRALHPELPDAVAAEADPCVYDARVLFDQSACGHGEVNNDKHLPRSSPSRFCYLCNLFSRCLLEANTSDEKVEFASARSSAILATLTEGISKLSGP